ncbi:hypothetical protein FOC4_g10001579 [Fusarium odoratissimum]|uniref:Uncharacterized protein n=1 Tax=Fusarium oxysporum f. sp. cubense (strain race 4) TaxID=2502994 RepID=N1S2X0_FUSC4|nr:hypothetical protein FOC4_g10001579 [Fusarium odoratissimum]
MGQSPVSSFQTPSRLERLKLGHCYFTASEKRLGAAISRVDTLSIQCLCLAGPVQALRLFHAAGSSLQILLSTKFAALHCYDLLDQLLTILQQPVFGGRRFPTHLQPILDMF